MSDCADVVGFFPDRHPARLSAPARQLRGRSRVPPPAPSPIANHAWAWVSDCSRVSRAPVRF
jgi:hypothetical protein